MPGQQKQPNYIRRCVASVAPEKGLDAAFAICTAAMQKAGYLEPGSRTQTDKGKARARQFAARKDFKMKDDEYELALDKAREESFALHFLAYIQESTND